MAERFRIETHAVRDFGLRQAKDRVIYQAAHTAGVVVMTKDADFVRLLERLGPPPQVLWITSGNTSNARLRDVLAEALPTALQLLDQGEHLVEISDAM